MIHKELWIITYVEKICTFLVGRTAVLCIAMFFMHISESFSAFAVFRIEQKGGKNLSTKPHCRVCLCRWASTSVKHNLFVQFFGPNLWNKTIWETHLTETTFFFFEDVQNFRTQGTESRRWLRSPDHPTPWWIRAACSDWGCCESSSWWVGSPTSSWRTPRPKKPTNIFAAK